MTEVQIIDRSGKTFDLTELEGRLYPRFAAESLKNVSTYKARPDDVLICSYPKAGTHWTFEIVRTLLAGSVDLPVMEKDDRMIEFIPPSQLESVTSPRNINSHFHFEKLSPDVLRQKSRIIHVTRNPRDLAVSFFHHHKKLVSYYNYHGDWKDYFHLFLEGKVDYDSWFEYTKGWEKGMKENPGHPFLVLSYEGMKQKPLESIRKIADFIGVKCSDEFIAQVADKTSIDSMKKQRAASEAEQLMYAYRKGKVGDWKNTFTVAQAEMFEKKFQEEMAGTDAYRLYSRAAQPEFDPNMNSV